MAKAPRYEGLTADMSLRDAAQTILRALLDAVLEQTSAVLRGDDTRAVHDMRVAIRRLRSALGTFEDCFGPRQIRTLRRATRRVGRKLGEVRDADVHLAALRATLGVASETDSPGIAFAIDALLARRRTALAEFAIELSQFDRESFSRVLANG